jgi:hypothetical protein
MAELTAMQQQLDVMRAENARLRLERQAPLSMGAAAERARSLLAATPELEDHPSEDSAATTLANAYMIRASILSVCEDLETTIGQLSLRLRSGAPAAELNRRVRDRRGRSADERRDDVPAGMDRRLGVDQPRGELSHAGGRNGDDGGGQRSDDQMLADHG